jgi:Bacterial PH domain
MSRASLSAASAVLGIAAGVMFLLLMACWMLRIRVVITESHVEVVNLLRTARIALVDLSGVRCGRYRAPLAVT